jgi:2-amino-4-hydroxy-6-hydroxymethyldihydropteridine diphosphokinase
MPLCLLGLGSNLGDRGRSLAEALARLGSQQHLELVRQSSFRETLPAGGPAGQAAYLNAAALVRTSLAPEAILHACQTIENELGRRREERWGPRTVDIDMLLYDGLVLNTPVLQLPHPRMAWRRFVLEPAAEIAAEMVHPVIGWSVSRLLEHLNSTPWYLAITGPVAIDKTRIAEEVARRTGARLLGDPFDAAQRAAFGHNPSSHGRQSELEFLQQHAQQTVQQLGLELLRKRASLLDREQAAWALADRPTVSDFWFDQTAVFGSVYLPQEQGAEYLERWREMRTRVVQPRLIAMVRPSLDALPQRIGSVVFALPAAAQLKHIADSLEQRAAAAEGPVVSLGAFDSYAAVVELTAAVEAMR